MPSRMFRVTCELLTMSQVASARSSVGVLVAEDVLREVVAEECDAAAIDLVFRSEESSARNRIVLAVLAVHEVRSDHAPIHGLAAIRQRGTSGSDFAVHRFQLRHA